MSEEIWKDIPDYEGVYQVSNFGNVKSLERYVVGGKGKRQLVPERILKQTSDSYGYRVVSLCDSVAGKSTKVKKVHRLVLRAFIGDSDRMGCHGDGDTANNYLTNLRYGTAQDNADDRYRHGKKVGASGSRNGMAKLTEEAVGGIKTLISEGKLSCLKIANMFEVSAETVRKIKIGKTWSHI
jgi:hypothetical protein